MVDLSKAVPSLGISRFDHWENGEINIFNVDDPFMTKGSTKINPDAKLDQKGFSCFLTRVYLMKRQGRLTLLDKMKYGSVIFQMNSWWLRRLQLDKGKIIKVVKSWEREILSESIALEKSRAKILERDLELLRKTSAEESRSEIKVRIIKGIRLDVMTLSHSRRLVEWFGAYVLNLQLKAEWDPKSKNELATLLMPEQDLLIKKRRPGRQTLPLPTAVLMESQRREVRELVSWFCDYNRGAIPLERYARSATRRFGVNDLHCACFMSLWEKQRQTATELVDGFIKANFGIKKEWNIYNIVSPGAIEKRKNDRLLGTEVINKELADYFQARLKALQIQ